MSRSCFFLLVSALLATVGCTGPVQAPPGIVLGRVVNRGEPVKDANIYFEMVDGDHSVFATLQADGAFQLKTNVSAGLPAGTYRVSFRPDPGTKMPLAGDDGPKLSHPLIPERFLDPSTSGLRVEVRSGENPSFEFDLGK